MSKIGRIRLLRKEIATYETELARVPMLNEREPELFEALPEFTKRYAQEIADTLKAHRQELEELLKSD